MANEHFGTPDFTNSKLNKTNKKKVDTHLKCLHAKAIISKYFTRVGKVAVMKLPTRLKRINLPKAASQVIGRLTCLQHTDVDKVVPSELTQECDSQRSI